MAEGGGKLLYSPDICPPSRQLAAVRLRYVGGVETAICLPSIRSDRRLLSQFSDNTADGRIILYDLYIHVIAVATSGWLSNPNN
jgi:hypothetical protein